RHRPCLIRRVDPRYALGVRQLDAGLLAQASALNSAYSLRSASACARIGGITDASASCAFDPVPASSDDADRAEFREDGRTGPERRVEHVGRATPALAFAEGDQPGAPASRPTKRSRSQCL